MMAFQDFGLNARLLDNIRTLGYTDPTPIQSQAIPAIMARRDVVGIAQTGTGKTAAFLLPIMTRMLDTSRGPATTLVLTPTRELGQQIESNFRKLATGSPLRSTLVVGGVPEHPQERALRGPLDLVVATPGRLLAHLRGGRVHLKSVHTLILDEADQMFDLGFFPDLQRILSFLPARKQTLLFSATMPPEVERLTQDILKEPLKITIAPEGTATSTVNQTIYPVPTHRKAALLEHLLEQMERPSVLVFTRTKDGARRLARHLSDAGHYVGELHSGRTPSQRTRTMQAFRNKVFPILIATNIAARGLDVRHITHVINFDVAGTPEEHVHRIGRAGRAGDEGEAYVLVAPDEGYLMSRIERRVGRMRRQTLADFDYGVRQPADTPRKGGDAPRKPGDAPRKPGKAPSKIHGARKPVLNKGLSEVNVSERRKTSRGQGRRR
jgi:ATP-dependent RNA helicase RhlE